MRLVSFLSFFFVRFIFSRLWCHPLAAHKSKLDLATCICVCVCLNPFVYLPSTRHPFVLMCQIYSSPGSGAYLIFFRRVFSFFFLLIFCCYSHFCMGLTRLTLSNCFWLTTDNVSDIFPSPCLTIWVPTYCHDTEVNLFRVHWLTALNGNFRSHYSATAIIYANILSILIHGRPN